MEFVLKRRHALRVVHFTDEDTGAGAELGVHLASPSPPGCRLRSASGRFSFEPLTGSFPCSGGADGGTQVFGLNQQ